MYFLSKPEADQIDFFLARAAQQQFSYPFVGATAGELPRGYKVDHNRVLLGRGEAAFGRAAEAVRRWKMFDFPLTEITCKSAEPLAGIDVAICAHHMGFYSLNACRVVYSIDDQLRTAGGAELKRFGFAYGTLQEHAESGEERFLIEWNRDTDEVVYDLLAFSRPQALLARLGYRVSRYYQRRFIICSQQAMKSAVETEPG